MASSTSVLVTEGSDKYIAGYAINEDTVTKVLQRVVMSDSDGNEISTTGGGFNVTLSTALSDAIDSIVATPKGALYTRMTASGPVFLAPCKIVGMYVSSTSSGTVKLWDNTAGSGVVIVNTITPSVGWHDLGVVGTNVAGYATLGGAIDVTFMYHPI